MLEDLSKLDAIALANLFVDTSSSFDPLHRRLGRIYWHLEQKLGRCQFGAKANNFKHRPTARKMLMDRGAGEWALQSAQYGARAWQLVEDKKINVEDFDKLTYADCVALARSQSYKPRPEMRKSLAPHVGEPVSELVTRVTGMTRSVPVPAISIAEKPQDREEAEKSVEALTVALAEAQRALLVARTHLARRMPPEWDNLISNSLTPLGRLRFSLQEWLEDHPAHEISSESEF